MKIMAALDHSAYADFVLKKAIKTALQQNAKLDIVTVVEDDSFAITAEEAERSARTHQQRAIEQGVKAKVRIFCGSSAAEEIIRYQKAEGLDLIVVGRRSHIADNPMGAVTLEVAAFATCTVMVVRSMEPRDFS